MLDLALIIDLGRGAFSTSNQHLAPPTMVAHVEATYDPSLGKPVSLTKAQREKYNRLRERWTACEQCGYPMGIHYGNEDPTLNHPHRDDVFVNLIKIIRAGEAKRQIMREVADIAPQGRLL
jgi:predicted TIM-barrel fold metal-dependent hydrolase